MKRLYRSEQDRMIAGVCAGLGEYFTIDPTLVRILFVVLLFTPAWGGLIYLILWLVLPAESDVEAEKSSNEYVKSNWEDMKGKAEEAVQTVKESVSKDEQEAAKSEEAKNGNKASTKS